MFNVFLGKKRKSDAVEVKSKKSKVVDEKIELSDDDYDRRQHEKSIRLVLGTLFKVGHFFLANLGMLDLSYQFQTWHVHFFNSKVQFRKRNNSKSISESLYVHFI